MDVTQSQAPKTAAERQAAHRARRQREYSHRINTYIPESAGAALRRLARHYGTSQADVIARLVLAQDDALLTEMPDEALDDYFGVTQ